MNTDGNLRCNAHQKGHVTLAQAPFGPHIVNKKHTQRISLVCNGHTYKGARANSLDEIHAFIRKVPFYLCHIIHQEGLLLLKRPDCHASGPGIPQAETGPFDESLHIRLVPVPNIVDQGASFPVGKPYSPSIKIQAPLHGLHNRSQHFLDVRQCRGCLSDLLDEQGIVVPDIDLIQ